MIETVLRMFAVTLAVLATLLALGCHSLQRKFLFYPSHHTNDNGFVRWTGAGGALGVAREAADPKNVWLMLHGNGGQAADRSYAMHAFDAGDSVYILEYPGYGQRAGSPSRKSFDTAARQGYAQLRARFPGKRVCIAGESIGSGPASVLSREKPPPDKIVLVVPFDRITDVARDHVRYLPVGLLLAGTWDNIKSLKGYTGPIEIFGAEKDEVIAVRHARALAQSVPQARFHLIAGGQGWANGNDVAFRCP
jgi:pimeloyl-ACP methyl ester carboxylesterase